MAHYLVQASFTSGSWATQIKDSQNKIEQVGKMFTAKGTKFLWGYYCFGDYDLCFIAEGPDNPSTASALIAAWAGGAISKMHTTVLMTPEEGLEAIKVAGLCRIQAFRLLNEIFILQRLFLNSGRFQRVIKQTAQYAVCLNH